MIQSVRRADIADTQQPIIVGRADESDLPYAVGRRVVDLAPDGTTRYRWTPPTLVVGPSRSGGRIVAIAAGSHRVAVEVEYENVQALRTYTSVFVLAARGNAIAKYSDVSETGYVTIRYAAPGVLLALPSRGAPGQGFVSSRFVVRSGHGARKLRDSRHGPDLALVDFVRGVIAYQTQHEIRAIRYADGKDVGFRPIRYRGLGQTSLATAGLAYAGSRVISWAPWSSIARRLD